MRWSEGGTAGQRAALEALACKKAVTNFQLCLCHYMSERQRCAAWIKKLCDPAAYGSGLTGRKNRNMYARLLLHMLKRGVLEGPFISKPEPGNLKTLPAYLVRVLPSAIINYISLFVFNQFCAFTSIILICFVKIND